MKNMNKRNTLALKHTLKGGRPPMVIVILLNVKLQCLKQNI